MFRILELRQARWLFEHGVSLKVLKPFVNWPKSEQELQEYSSARNELFKGLSYEAYKAGASLEAASLVEHSPQVEALRAGAPEEWALQFRDDEYYRQNHIGIEKAAISALKENIDPETARHFTELAFKAYKTGKVTPEQALEVDTAEEFYCIENLPTNHENAEQCLGETLHGNLRGADL